MNRDSENMQELTLEIKQIIDNIDNIKLDVDLYAAFVDEKVMIE